MKENILVIEDDVQISNFILYTLENEGFSVKAATMGKEGLRHIQKEDTDLVLLDLGLPDIDGMEVLREIRKTGEIPVIIVSARDQDREKADALDGGADDYLTKPFSTTELMARIRVALRHYSRIREEKKTEEEKTYRNGGLFLDTEKHMVLKNGEEIHLSPLEYNLLLLFMKNQGKALTYRYILKNVWGEGYGQDTQVLRTVMASTRRKIEDNPGKPRYILTEIGVGYRMKEQEEK